MAAEEQITIIAEDAEAEAAAEAREQQLQLQREESASAAAAIDEAAAAPESLMQFDRSQRTPSQQHALPPHERPRPSLAHGAGQQDSGRKGSVRMSTQLLLPPSRRKAAAPAASGSGSGRPGSPKLDNFIDEVPQPSRPRFSSSMSLEAQFAMMKAYESRLRTKILSANPEFANVLHVSPDPPVDMRRPQVSLKQRPATSRVSGSAEAAAAEAAATAAAAAAAAAAGGKRKAQRSQSLAPERSQISEETQLDLARRLQYAQYLSDYFVIKQGEPCLNYSLLRDKKDFNPIKKFNWWSSWWSRDFEFQEEPEKGSARSHDA